MKITFQFLDALKNLLENDDWQKSLKQRLEEIDISLNKSVEQTCSDIVKKWTKARSNTAAKELESSLHKKHQHLKQEKQELLNCLANSSYKLGIAPFQNIADAKLLLVNIHILLVPGLNFNTAAVEAVKNMLKNNFTVLSDDEVRERFIEINNTSLDHTILTSSFTSKLLDTIPLIVDDVLGYCNIQNNLATPEIVHKANLAVIKFKYMSAEKVEIYRYLNYISQFYKYGHLDVNNILFIAAVSFTDLQAVKQYLKQVNYSSLQSFEASFFNDTSGDIKLDELPSNIIDIWRQINTKFGMTALKLSSCYVHIYQEHADIFDNTNIDIIFNNIKKLARNFTYKNYNSNIALANLCLEYKQSEAIFNKILTDIVPHAKTSDDLPDITFTITMEDKQFHFSKLAAGDLQGLFLGLMTACCQYIGGEGEKCAIDGFTRQDAGFYVITDKSSQIKAQSYAWLGVNNLGRNILVLDSFEYLVEVESIFVTMSKILAEKLSAFNFGLYVGCGGKTPELQADRQSINSQNSDLYRYADSKMAYEITNDVKLVNKQSIKLVALNIFNDYIDKNERAEYAKYKLKHKEFFDSLAEDRNKCICAYRLMIFKKILYNLTEKKAVGIDKLVDIVKLNPLEDSSETCWPSKHHPDHHTELYCQYITYIVNNKSPAVAHALLLKLQNQFYSQKPPTEEYIEEYVAELESDISLSVNESLYLTGITNLAVTEN